MRPRPPRTVATTRRSHHHHHHHHHHLRHRRRHQPDALAVLVHISPLRGLSTASSQPAAPHFSHLSLLCSLAARLPADRWNTESKEKYLSNAPPRWLAPRQFATRSNTRLLCASLSLIFGPLGLLGAPIPHATINNLVLDAAASRCLFSRGSSSF